MSKSFCSPSGSVKYQWIHQKFIVGFIDILAKYSLLISHSETKKHKSASPCQKNTLGNFIEKNHVKHQDLRPIYQCLFAVIHLSTCNSNPASKVVQIRAALVPVPSPDKWGGLRQEGHPA